MNSRFHRVNASHITITFSAKDGDIERLREWVEFIWHNSGVDALEKNQINLESVISDVKIFDFTKSPLTTLGIKVKTFATDNKKKELWEKIVLSATGTIVEQSQSSAIISFNDGRIISLNPAP